MRQDGVGDPERHKGLAHPNLMSEDLNFVAFAGYPIEKAIKYRIDGTLLPRCVSGILDQLAVTPQIEVR
jgi:hypothetical protein